MKKSSFRLSVLIAAALSLVGPAARAEQAGRTFYVDADQGADTNPGTDRAAPWKSTAPVLSTAFGPGDRVLFKSGCLWRLDKTLAIHAKGREDRPVVVSSYGEGPKPEFRASLDGTVPGFWRFDESTGLWYTPVSGQTDVGNIVYVRKGSSPDAPSTAWKRWTRDDLKAEGDFCHDRAHNLVWLKFKCDPAEVCSSMELCRKIGLITVGDTEWLVVEGLALTHTGAHGITGAPVRHLRVRGCDFGWIGGSWLANWPDGKGGKRPIRYGNGIEFWAYGHSKDIRLENNFFYEVYDTAMTNQGNKDGVLEDMVICSNRTLRCEQSYEIWFTHTNYFVKSIEVFGNRFEDAGFGWSHAQRPDKNATHFLAYNFLSRAGDLRYHDNYLGRTKQCMFWWFTSPVINHVKLDRNTYVAPGIDAATHRGLFHWKDAKGRDCLPRWDDYRRITGYDAHSVLQTPEESDPEERRRIARLRRSWLVLPNGDFEDPQPGSTGAFHGWSVTDRPKDLKSVAVADADVRHGGQYALRVEARPDEKIQVARNVDLHDPVFVPGRTYRIRAWMRTKADAPQGTWSFDFGVYAKGLKYLVGHGFPAPKGDDGWQEVSHAFTLPPNGEFIRLMFNFRHGAVGWIDDVVLEERREDGSFVPVYGRGY